jgi:plasmid stability protein
MSSLTINIKEEYVEALRQKAAQSRISMEQLIEKYIQQMLESNERDTLMEQATEYVLNKNNELLKRLA